MRVRRILLGFSEQGGVWVWGLGLGSGVLNFGFADLEIDEKNAPLVGHAGKFIGSSTPPCSDLGHR